MKYEDLRDIVINIKTKRNHLNDGEKLCVRVDLDTLSYYEGLFIDMTAHERMIRMETHKGVKYIAIQHIVAVSYWVDKNPILE